MHGFFSAYPFEKGGTIDVDIALPYINNGIGSERDKQLISFSRVHEQGRAVSLRIVEGGLTFRN